MRLNPLIYLLPVEMLLVTNLGGGILAALGHAVELGPVHLNVARQFINGQLLVDFFHELTVRKGFVVKN